MLADATGVDSSVAPETDEVEDTLQTDSTPRSNMPTDALAQLLAGRARCVEFSGGHVFVDAPRRHKVVLAGSFDPLHQGD